MGHDGSEGLLAWAAARLGYVFANPVLLLQAVTHPSSAHETGNQQGSNQRLEFLGDAVVGLVVAHLVFAKFPGWPEGRLTKLKNTLVSAPILAKRARHLGIGAHLRLGRGEERAGGADRESNLADAFEAIVGALYLDGGITVAHRLVQQELQGEIPLATAGRLAPNYKAALLELAQARQLGAPTYEVIATAGPEHSPEFSVVVKVGNEAMGEGNGPSKKAAEQAAAERALSRLGSVG